MRRHNEHQTHKTQKGAQITQAAKRRSRGWKLGSWRNRPRSKGVLAGSPPGAGGRLIDLRPRLY